MCFASLGASTYCRVRLSALGGKPCSGLSTASQKPYPLPDQGDFPGGCIRGARCGNCMRVCPSIIIHPDTGQSGILGFMSPVVRYETDYCIKECNACTKACPSRALHLLNLEQKYKYVIGTAQLDKALCFHGISDCNARVNACLF